LDEADLPGARLGLREAAANARAGAGTVLFAPSPEGSTLVLTGGELVPSDDATLGRDQDNDRAEVTPSGHRTSRLQVMVWRFLAAAALALLLATGLAGTAAQATHVSRCGGQYNATSLYWQTVEPPVAQVLAHLPADKRKTSGNVLSLDYRLNASGGVVNRTEFNQHWTHIFGTSTAPATAGCSAAIGCRERSRAGATAPGSPRGTSPNA
jgi:hypothetical protein